MQLLLRIRIKILLKYKIMIKSIKYQIYAIMNNPIGAAIAIIHTNLFQSKIFCPSNTPNGIRLNIAIQPLNDAPIARSGLNGS